MYELTEQALVAASVEKVWQDWTDSDALVAWMWPPRLEATATIDPRPQGVWEIRSEVAGIAVRAVVLAADEPRLLRLAWRWEGEEATTDAQITLERAADGARVRVHHTGFATPEERESHIEGWSNCLARLVERHNTAPVV